MLFAGVVQWLEFQPSKLAVWVRFPSPAPKTDKFQVSLSVLFFAENVDTGEKHRDLKHSQKKVL